MSKFAQGVYNVKNKEKYLGKSRPIYRSSWENHFMQFCDNNSNIIEWASEPLRIPYVNPQGKKTTYVPDFLIRYYDKNHKIVTELIEIKPYNQVILTEKTKPALRAIITLNEHKWHMAKAWCKHNGIKFRILTERELFIQKGRQRK